MFFGKHKGSKWSDLNGGYLEWVVQNMGDESKGPAGKMATQEIARRAGQSEGEVVDAEFVEREPGSDDDLPLDGPPSDDPRFA